MSTPDARVQRLTQILADKMLELGPVSHARLRKGGDGEIWYLAFKWLGSDYQAELDWVKGRVLLYWGIARLSVQLTHDAFRVGERAAKSAEDAVDLMIAKMGQRA